MSGRAGPAPPRLTRRTRPGSFDPDWLGMVGPGRQLNLKSYTFTVVNFSICDGYSLHRLQRLYDYLTSINNLINLIKNSLNLYTGCLIHTVWLLSKGVKKLIFPDISANLYPPPSLPMTFADIVFLQRCKKCLFAFLRNRPQRK